MSTDVSKCNQVVFELLCKVAELIVSAKVCLHQQRRATINSKFSLHVQELDVVRNSMKAWENNLSMPVGIDIFWEEHRRGDAAPRRELLERWEIMYEAHDVVESKSSQLRHFFKRSIILLRTLYSFVRLLPAYSVHKRIQSRDPSLVHSQDDTGFCLYPGGSSGSGLSFGSLASGGEEQVGQSDQSASTSFYAFKPLDAPNGSVKVMCHHRRGVDSEAYQNGQTSTPSLTPNMTTSLIQDYVPDEYERTTAVVRTPAVEMNHDLRLPSTPEDGASRLTGAVDSYGQHAGVQAQVDCAVGNAPVRSGAFMEADVPDQDVVGADTVHWPSPELGHGYAERRVHKLVGQGPAPFLTPGPHRGRMLGLSNFTMEPLELGPNAGSDPRGPPLQDMVVQQENDDVYEVGDPPRFSAQDISAGSGRAESHGSTEFPASAMVRTVEGGHGRGVRDRVRPYRRNSISESSSTPPVLSLHGTRHTTGHRHGTSTDSTPPFSYCDSVSSEASPLALGQPLVSFSPPFDAAHVGPHRHDNTCGQESSRVVNSSPLFGMRVHHPRTSVPVLETLPESPFSWKGNRENIQPAAATSPASFSRPLLPASLSNSRQGPKPAIDPGADRAEGLPFSVEVRDDEEGACAENSNAGGGVEGGLHSSSPPSTLFALCSASSSKSIFLMHNPSEPSADAFSLDRDVNDAPATSYASTTGIRLPTKFVVRSLEEDLEVFRSFQQELEQPPRPT